MDTNHTEYTNQLIQSQAGSYKQGHLFTLDQQSRLRERPQWRKISVGSKQPRSEL